MHSATALRLLVFGVLAAAAYGIPFVNLLKSPVLNPPVLNPNGSAFTGKATIDPSAMMVSAKLSAD